VYNATDIVEVIKKDGIMVLEQAAPIHILHSLKNEFHLRLKESNKLKLNDKAFAAVSQPFIHCRDTVTLAMMDLLHDIVRAYLGKVKLGTCNLRRSHKHTGGPVTTEMFHCDGNCGKKPDGTNINILKFFFYLNNVDENGGPFEYAIGSVNNKPKGWNKSYRMPDEWVYSNYETRLMTAKFGDIIVADTTGFHRGKQVIETPRDMFTINFVPSKEIGEEFSIFKEDVPVDKLKTVEYLKVL